MKKFKGDRTLEEVKELLKEKYLGVMSVNDAIQPKGDGYRIKWYINDEDLDLDERYGYIDWLPRKGMFWVKTNSEERIATYLSEELDEENWYNEILDLLYKS